MDNKTKPPRSLGQLETLAIQLGALQSSATPRMETCTLILFIADHGIVEDGVSAYAQVVTQQMAQNFLGGGAAANVLANTHNVGLKLVDAGMIEAIDHPDLIDARIARGTQNFRLGPAMTVDQCQAAMAAGERIACATAADALCFGEMGIGNTSAASLLLHKALALPLDDLIGRGTGLDDAALAQKRSILHAAADRTPTPLPAQSALQEYGGFEIAMMVGGMVAAAQARKLVIVDGFIATAAAVIAQRMEPQIHPALVFAHRSAEAGHGVVLKHLAVKPLLDLNLRLGEGTGGLLAWPLIRSAAAILCDMASFASANIDGRTDANE